MEYKWIAQDQRGRIDKYMDKPTNEDTGWWDISFKNVTKGRPNKDWENSLINLETHDYKIEDGILMKVEKEQILKGSELQYRPFKDANWSDCGQYEYRIKPKTKVVRFRNYLAPDGVVGVCIDGDMMSSENEWLGDWQEVEVEIK